MLREMIRAYIASQKDNFVIAEFRKKDGTLRRMPFRPSEAAEHLDPNATERGREIAARTMENNPHLMRVWDFEVEGYRTLNLSTLNKLITKDGVTLFARDSEFNNVNILIEK